VISIILIIIAGIVGYFAGSQAAPVVTVAKKPFEGVTITYLTTSPMVTPDLDRLFEELTGAKVEVVSVSWPDLRPKLVTALTTKSSDPDVYILPDEWVLEFGDNGWLEPLDQYIPKERLDDMLEIHRGMYTYKGHIIGAPIMVMPMIMFYNEKILRDAGFDKPPSTWEELLEMSTSLKEKGIVDYSITWPLLSGDDMLTDVFLTVLLSSGGRIVDEEGNPAFNDEHGLWALNFIVNTIYEYKIAPETSFECEKMEALRPFMTGENAFNINWQFMVAMARSAESKVAEYVRYAPIPVKKGETPKYTGLAAGGALAVNPYSDAKEAAIAYVLFITDPAFSLKLFAERGWLPAWKSFYENPAAKQIEPQIDVLLEQLSKSYARGWTGIKDWAKFSEIIRLTISKVWLEGVEPQEVLNSAAEQAKALIGKK